MSKEEKTPIEKVFRKKISINNDRALYAITAGRCEFRGCNDFILEHSVTKNIGNFSDKAHIVAFKEKAARGNHAERPEDINALDNLMLLCKKCHKEIDDNPENYPVEMLKGMKNEHEMRVEAVLGLPLENKSHILVFTAPIGGQRTSIKTHECREAMLPYWPIERNPSSIDLNTLLGGSEDNGFIKQACEKIKYYVQHIVDNASDAVRAGHISIFGIAPIPLLIYLGALIGDKIPSRLYQRHRIGGENWQWREPSTNHPVQYDVSCVQDKGIHAPVGIMLALSGNIDLSTLPEEMSQTFSLYKVTLKGQQPTPTFLMCERDLDAFIQEWMCLQSTIADKHGDEKPVHIFPAIPAPIAISCGRNRLSKIRSKLIIYDRINNAFVERLTIQGGIDD